MPIPFEKVFESARFRSPLENMQEVEHVIERRRDPLTGRWAIGSKGLEGKGQFFFGPTDFELLEEVAEQSRATCFFCPENVEKTTPRYPESLLPRGCLRVGECFLFPNLFPLSGVHAVVALGEKHVRRLSEFSAGLLRDGLEASIRFVRSVHAAESANVAFTVNANYLFPAGASIVHPHLQIFGGRHVSTSVIELMNACGRYQEDHGGRYFEQLVTEERAAGERYIAREGRVHWLTPFAPMGTNEVLAILEGREHLLMLDEDAVDCVSRGLSCVLAYYEKIGFSTFNLTLYSAPLDSSRKSFPVFLRVVCRQNVRPNYRADDYFIQKLLGEELMLTTPEQLAAGLRDFWTTWKAP